MNDDEQLFDAARALRLARGGASPLARRTEERVLSRAARNLQRKRRLHLLLPIAAVLAVSSAWAAADGRLARVAQALRVRLWAADAAMTSTHTKRQEPPSSAPAIPRTVAEQPPPTPPPELSATSPQEARHAAPRKPAPAPAASAVVTAPAELLPARPAGPLASAQSPLALYQHAHELHFRRHTPAAALAAWDEYLAAAPTGPLSLEARYNRAICLVQLGRHDEARAALAPFARGDYGDYRQAEAKALLERSSVGP